MQRMSFAGRSGRTYSFERYAADAPWARQSGVALFCASGPFGWRIVRMVRLTGRLHDVQPVWAFSDAQRYGASAVFVSAESDASLRDNMLADLEAGLSPVFSSTPDPVELAA